MLAEARANDLQQIAELNFSGGIGAIFGGALGSHLFSGSPLERVAGSAIFGVIGENFAEFIEAGFSFDYPLELDIEYTIFDDLGEEFLSAGVGALSSLLVAEAIAALGVDGFAGEVLNTAAGAVVGKIFSNIVGIGDPISVFSGIDLAQLANAFGSFLGTMLAQEVNTFDTIGGQLGSAIGSSLGAIGFTAAAVMGSGASATLLGLQLGALAGPLGAAIGAFAGFLIGGVIGSIFGGVPRSGADVVWSESAARFVVENEYSKKGGSEEAATSFATVVSQTLNGLLEASGARLLSPDSISTGNFGTYKNELVYRKIAPQGKDTIAFRVDGGESEAHNKLISYGISQALFDEDFQLVGGSPYVKRAIYRTIEDSLSAGETLNIDVLLGNISVAQSYEDYRQDPSITNAVISLAPDSALAASLAITLSRASELKLNRRHASDWYGGFGELLQEVSANTASAEIGFELATPSGHLARFISVEDAIFRDTISVQGQTRIGMLAGDVVAQIVDLRSGVLADQTGLIINGRERDDIAHSDADFVVVSNVASSIGANDLRATAALTAAANDPSETIEAFRVKLGDGAGSYLQRGNADVTIVDSADAAHLMVGRSYASEADGHLVWRVSLSKAASTAVGLELAISPDRAEAGVDYNDQIEVSADGLSGWTSASTVTLAAGTTEYFVRVAVTDDNVANPDYEPYEFDSNGLLQPNIGNGQPEYFGVEGQERVVLSATVTSGAAGLQNGDETVSGVGTIVDGSNTDPLVWIDDLIIHEGTSANISIARSRATGSTSSFTYSTADNRVLDIPVAATVDAGGGDDTVHASDLGDNIFGGDGNDELYGGRLDDWLLGGAGNDILHAGNATGGLGGDGNYLNGGDGNDQIHGREGSDWLEGGAGVDTLQAGAGGDILSGGADDGDQLHGGAGDDTYLLRVGDGADIIDDVDPVSPLLAPNEAIQWREATSGDWLASATADQVFQDADSLGTENYIQTRYARMALGSEQPNYFRKDWLGYFTPGVSGDGLGGGEDSLSFGYGIGIGDIRLIKSSDARSLIVQVMDDDGIATGDQMTLTDWFVDPFKRIEWLKFADGNEIRIADITTFIAGTNGNDTLIGTNGNDFIYGGAGSDRIFLLAGDDIGSGGSGMDYVAGDSGDDLIVGGSDSDALTGGAGMDVLTGDGGNDDLYGGAGNDIISGGRGNDHLVGGAGDDIFKYSRGDGADVMFDDFAGTWQTVWARSGSGNGGFANGYSLNPDGSITDGSGTIVRQVIETEDGPQFQWVGRWDYDSVNQVLTRYVEPTTGCSVSDADGTESWRWDDDTDQYTSGNSRGDLIEFAPGINIQDIVLRQSGNDLVMHVSRDGGSSGIVSGEGDSITLRDWYLAVGNIERLAFLATGELDLENTGILAGTDAADILVGSSGADWATGGTGDDEIDGGAGNDILSGNGGADIIRGGDGDDVLYGGSGDDVLIGGANATILNAQGDILIGGAGSDWASYEDESDALYVSLANPSYNSGVAQGDNYVSIENLRGGSGNDQLFGDDGDNILEGGAGNDMLFAGLGDDTYIWNATSASSNDGATIIREGSRDYAEAIDENGNFADHTSLAHTGRVLDPPPGEDPPDGTLELTAAGRLANMSPIYGEGQTSFGPGDIDPTGWTPGFLPTGHGSQVALEIFEDTVDGGEDTLLLGEGITLADLTFIETGGDLIIQYRGSSTSQITIEDQDTVGGRVEILEFHSGLSARLDNLRVGINGSTADDLIVGSLSAETLLGFEGDDVIFGGAGNDTIEGRAGDDHIEGGAGADVLDGGANSANDGTNPRWGDTLSYESSTGGTITVDFRTQSDINNAQSGGDAQGDKIFGFENYIGSAFNKDIWDGDDNDNRAQGLGGHDLLRGNGGDDVLLGGDGNDTLHGGDGEDNLAGDAGNDYLGGNAGNDFLYGGAGTDRLYGHGDNDILLGGDGDDGGTINSVAYGLFGGDGDDQLDGGAGNDDLYGEAGNDRLIGGIGNDTLDGGAGNDIFYFGGNDGVDVVTDTDGTNTIVFGFGFDATGTPQFDQTVGRNDLWLTRSGDDLKIAVIGGDTDLTVTGFFAATGASLVERIQTADGTLFLGDPAVHQLITNMTAHSATVPAEAPSEFVDQIARAWADSDTPAPRAPEVTQTVEITTLTPNAFNLDQWPEIPPTGKGEANLVDDDGWQGDVDSYPSGDAQITGWGSFGSTGENVWDGTTPGPYGSSIVSLTALQNDPSSNRGGGLRTNEFQIDGQKAYEVTLYFRREASSGQQVVFGAKTASPSGPFYAQNATLDPLNATGDNNPRFYKGNATEQDASFEAGKWYKAVAYVFAEGSDAIAAGQYGGIYDTETGDKVAEVDNFRWDPNRPDDNISLSFWGFGGSAGDNINFFEPEIREVLDTRYMMRDGDELNLWTDSRLFIGGQVEGFLNSSWLAYDGEARWTEVAGPDGQAMVVVEAGQFDANSNGGGNVTNDIVIDPARAYRYVQYFRKTDLTKHGFQIGLQPSTGSSGILRRLTDGAVLTSGDFLAATSATLSSSLVEDEWYMLDGYVLPDGTAPASVSGLGGVYRVSDGSKVAGLAVNDFFWGSSGPISVRGRYQTQYDHLVHGWSTQFGAPEFSAVSADQLAALQADPFLTANDIYGDAVTIDASIGVTDFDSNISSWALYDDGAPAKGKLVSINETTGAVIYRPRAGATGTDSFSVVVIDADGNQTVVPINVNLTLGNVNAAPVIDNTSLGLSINENSAAGQLVGTLAATDSDGGLDYMFSRSLMTMVGGKLVTFSDDEAFRIERDSGKVIFNADNLALDHESGQEFSYGIRVTDRNSGFNSRASYGTLTISVADVNEAHAMVNAAVEINHYNRALGPFIPMPDSDGFAINLYDLMITDQENSRLNWSILSTGHPFSIGVDGTLHLDGVTTSGTSYTLIVQAVDSETGHTTSATLTLNANTVDGFTAHESFFESNNFQFDWFRSYAYLPPIVLDLDGDGVELVSISTSTIRFDMDGDGNRDRTGWVAADDGLLALDTNGDGLITNGSEISFQQYVEGAFSDLDGLAFFDTNANGMIDAGDDRFADFVVWRDADQDGVSDAGELLSLAELGVESIALVATRTGNSPGASDNVIYANGTYRTTGGVTGAIADTFLVFDPLAYLNDEEDQSDTGTDGNNGGGAPDAPDAGDTGPAMEFGRMAFGRKSSKYRLTASGGNLVIGPKNSSNPMSPGAGLVNGATMLSFRSWNYGMVGAVMLDLDHDGIETRRYKGARAAFDMDGNGTRDDVGWSTGADGFLVIDRNGNGRIDDASEMAFLNSDGDLQYGRTGLAALDSNGDGRVSAGDTLFASLGVWHDRNRDGVTDQGEFRLLSEHGIESLGLGFTAVEESKKVGYNVTIATGVFTRTDGTTGTIGDVALGFVPSANRRLDVRASVIASVIDGPRIPSWARDSGQFLNGMDFRNIHDFWVGDDLDMRGSGPLAGLRDRLFVAVNGIEEAPASNADLPDIPAEAVLPSTGAGEHGDTSMAAKLALLRQEMAAFGGNRGLDSTPWERDRTGAPIDYFI
ncbi:membrane hypothetical protein [Erythrobacter sp. EC-HK427]|nr:membrane hypothetical protein [Erythrobacter sp. EC-HK427]